MSGKRRYVSGVPLASKNVNRARRLEAAHDHKEKRIALRKQRYEHYQKCKAEGIEVEKPDTNIITKVDKYEYVDEMADDDVIAAEAKDEFAEKLTPGFEPKTLLTTISDSKISGITKRFVVELQQVIETLYLKERPEGWTAADVVKYAVKKGYTSLIIIEQGVNSKPAYFYFTNLPTGPTFRFRIVDYTLARGIEDAVPFAAHYRPEIMMNNFNTILGRRVGRGLSTIFPPSADFVGRRVINFQNEGDFVYMRHYTYVFKEDGEGAVIRECGPRLDLKLRSIQEGAMDLAHGHYEWFWKVDLVDKAYSQYL